MDIGYILEQYSKRILAVIVAIAGALLLMWALKTKVPKINDQTQKLEAEITGLQDTYKNLKEMADNMEENLQKTEQLRADTDLILEEFPVQMYLEDNILYVRDMLQNELKTITLKDTSYGQAKFELSTAYGDGMPLELNSVGISSKFLGLSYAQLKALLDYGLDSKQRFVMNHLKAAFNEEDGYLAGDFSFKTFFIKGQDGKVYEFDKDVLKQYGEERREGDLFDSRSTAFEIPPVVTPEEIELDENGNPIVSENEEDQNEGNETLENEENNSLEED